MPAGQVSTRKQPTQCITSMVAECFEKENIQLSLSCSVVILLSLWNFMLCMQYLYNDEFFWGFIVLTQEDLTYKPG